MSEYQTLIANWARNLQFRPRRVEVPATLFELCDVVKRALGEGRHVRAIGSRWSFSDALVTNDVLVSCEKLEGVLGVASPRDPDTQLSRALLPQVRGRSFVYVRGGTQLSKVLQELHARGLAIRTMGSSAGQHVAGLLATGSHGADFDLPPPVDFVRAIHLVTADGSERWIERAEPNAITSKGGVALVAPSVERRHVLYDDQLFRAAAVSVGCLGIVYGLVLEVRESYALQECVETVEWTKLRAALEDQSAFTTPPVGNLANGVQYRYLEAFINLYPRASDGKRIARVTTRFEAPRATAPPGWQRQDRSLNFLEMLRVFTTVPSKNDTHYHELIEFLVSLGREDTPGFVNAVDVLDTRSGRPIPLYSVELAIGTRNGAHLRLLDGILSAFDARLARGEDFAGFISVRFTKSSQAYLAMQAPRRGDDPARERVMHVEIFALQHLTLVPPHFSDPQRMAVQNAECVNDFVRIGRELGARLHWGQWSPRTVGHHASWYVEAEEWLHAKRRLAPATARDVASFDGEFSVRAGLAALRPGWSASGCIPTTQSRAPSDTRALRVHEPALVPIKNDEVLVIAANGDGRVGSAIVGKPWVRVPEPPEDHHVVGRLTAERDGRGRIYAIAAFEDGRLRFSRAQPGLKEWTAFSRIDGNERVGSPASCVDAQGSIRVFAVETGTTTTRLLTRAQNLTSGLWDGAWTALPSPAANAAYSGAPAAVRDAQGTLEVFVRGGAELFAIRSSAQGWAAPRNLGVETRADPVAIAAPGGVLVVLIDGGSILALFRPTGQSDFTAEWLPMTASIAAGTRPTAAALGTSLYIGYVDHDGVVNVFVRTAQSTRFVPSQRVPASSVSGAALGSRRGVLLLATRAAHDLVQICEIGG